MRQDDAVQSGERSGGAAETRGRTPDGRSSRPERAGQQLLGEDADVEPPLRLGDGLAAGVDAGEGTQRLVSGAELARRADAAAAWLRATDLGAGDLLAWHLPNCVEVIVLYLACWRARVVAMPLHHRLSPEAAAEQAASFPNALFLTRELLGELESCVESPESAGSTTAAATDGPGRGAGIVQVPGTESAAASEPAVALFTSGSSGLPKAVVHTHGTLASKAASMVRIHGLGEADTVLMPLPMAHISGLLNGLLVPAAAGMRTVLMERWNPAEALRIIQREGVSFMVGPPPLFESLMASDGFSPEAVASLRVISTGGMGVTPEFIGRASERLSAVVKRSYGSTEFPTATTTAVDDPPEMGATSDGRAHGDTRIRIVDPDTGAELGTDHVGEIQLGGPECFVGYLRSDGGLDPLPNSPWFRTGDLGALDAGGWLGVVGRLDDRIIRAGENIAPSEVERILLRHPGVDAAVVLGRPDDRLGETVAAFVVAPGGLNSEQCRTWFAEVGAPSYVAPETVVLLDEIPALDSGKPDLGHLRATLADHQAEPG